jgi:hypothetical protein
LHGTWSPSTLLPFPIQRPIPNRFGLVSAGHAVHSLPPGEQVHDPATADVFARLPAVVQDVGVVASGVLERIGQDRHPVECSLSVDAFSQSDGGFGTPRSFNGDGAEGIAEDVSEEVALSFLFNGFSLLTSRFFNIGTDPKVISTMT